MPHIDEAVFGRLVVSGKVYRAPTVVYPDSVDGRWWRKDGMSFSPEDFARAVEYRPDIVVMGVGFMNKVSVAEETKKLLESEGIEYVVLDTTAAVERYNEVLGRRKVIGAFYLL
jgi:hypothetical protein